jgi:hypothetical protein
MCHIIWLLACSPGYQGFDPYRHIHCFHRHLWVRRDRWRPCSTLECVTGEGHSHRPGTSGNLHAKNTWSLSLLKELHVWSLIDPVCVRFQGCAISSTCFDFICMPLGLGVVYQAAAASSPATLRAARQTSSVYKSCQETPGSKMFKDFQRCVWPSQPTLKMFGQDSLVFSRPVNLFSTDSLWTDSESEVSMSLFPWPAPFRAGGVESGGFPGFPAQDGNEGWPCLPFVMTEHHICHVCHDFCFFFFMT